MLLDLKLPRISGLEVLKAVREAERCLGLPVIVFSSSGEPADVASSYRLHANCYVQKPVDYDGFIRAVTTTIQYWANHVKLPLYH